MDSKMAWYVKHLPFPVTKPNQNLEEKYSALMKYEKASPRGMLTYSITSCKINYVVQTQLLNDRKQAVFLGGRSKAYQLLQEPRHHKTSLYSSAESISLTLSSLMNTCASISPRENVLLLDHLQAAKAAEQTHRRKSHPEL